jgi:hypothetical protein
LEAQKAMEERMRDKMPDSVKSSEQPEKPSARGTHCFEPYKKSNQSMSVILYIYFILQRTRSGK